MKAVFFDIDGTLVSFHTHRVPESAAEAIRQLQKQGIKVFIATGRHMKVVNNLGTLKFDGYITLNGTCCYAGDSEVIYERAIPVTAIEALLRYQKEQENFPCIFVREQDMFSNYNNAETAEVCRLLNFPEPPVREPEEALRKNVLQLMAFFKAEQEGQIMPFLPGCEAARWSSVFTDIVPAGGSKRVGMEKILEYYGIPASETMAFGDGGNDIPMLQYAGIGVAMGNASEEVQQQADFVTRSVEEGGIAYALRHFGLLE